MPNKLTVFLLTAGILLSGSAAAFSLDTKYASNFRRDFGVRLFEDGKTDQAVEQFVQSLLLDPSNQAAKQSLKDILRQPDLTLNAHRLNLLRFLELLEYTDFLTSRIDHLEASNTQALEFIRANAQAYESGGEVADIIGAAIMKEKDALEDMAIVFSRRDLARGYDIDKINSRYLLKKSRLTAHLEFLQDASKQLRSLKLEVARHVKRTRRQELTEKSIHQIRDIKRFQEESIEKRQQEEIIAFNAESEKIRQQFAMFKAELGQMQERIADLTKQLAEMSLMVYEKDSQLADRDEKLIAFVEDLRDTKEKLNLAHRIIREKDEQISALENRATEQPPAGRVLPGNSKTLTRQLAKKNEEISRLRANIAVKNDKLVNLKKTKDAQLFGVRRALAHQAKVADDYRALLITRAQEIDDLNNILSIYKDKLYHVTEILKEKSEKLDYLERQFQEINYPDAGADPSQYPDLSSAAAVLQQTRAEIDQLKDLFDR